MQRANLFSSGRTALTPLVGVGALLLTSHSSAFALLASMTTSMWIGYVIGSISGLALGCLLYGGVGYLLFGTTGLIGGCCLALGFALYGLGLINPFKTPELFR